MPEPREIIEVDAVRKLMWAGLLAATTALAGIAAHRASVAIWVKVFSEEPPTA